LRWKEWNSTHFLFHPPSGQTHFLNQTARDIIYTLNAGPKSSRDVCMALRKQYETAEDKTLDDAIAYVLEMLDNLGVIARAT
jgi:PqqD family protein of HPr-rel-A system